MNKSIFKPIVFGVLFGALAFLMPFFLLRVLFFFLIVGALFRLFGRRRHRQGWGGGPMAFAERVRSMSDEEFEAFRTRAMQHRQHCGRGPGRRFQGPAEQDVKA